MKKTTIPFHLILLPLFPVVSLVAQNIDELMLHAILVPQILTLAAVLGTWILIWLIVERNMLKSALAVSLAFFILRPFTDVTVLTGSVSTFIRIASHNITLYQTLLAALGLTIIFKPIKLKFDTVTIIGNIFAVTFCIIPFFVVGKTLCYHIIHPIPRITHVAFAHMNEKSKDLPDIYYIISDRYANQQSLKDYYNFDNSDFYKQLSDRGFYIASQSAANYPFTEPSLASSLNLSYLDDIINKSDKSSEDETPILNALENNEAIRYLKSRGYTYYHFGAQWVTPTNRNADYQYSYSQKSMKDIQWELTSLYNQPNNEIGKFLNVNENDVTTLVLSKPENEAGYLLDQLLELSKIVGHPGPKFVFVHSLLTHDPYVFDKWGAWIDTEATNLKSDAKPKYLGQLQFANQLWIATLDTIMKESPTPPIIIFQSDEGPYPRDFRQNLNGFNWQKQATTADLREKIRILNSYYLPGKSATGLYPSISPVNSFREVFNLYLGESLPLLPDNHFAQVHYTFPYDVFNVNDKVK